MGKTSKKQSKKLDARRWHPVNSDDIKGVLALQEYKEGGVGWSEVFRRHGLNHPREVFTRPSFMQLLDDVLPEKFVINEHSKLFKDHKDIKTVPIPTTDDEVIAELSKEYENAIIVKDEKRGVSYIITVTIDRQARKDALEMAYKLRGSFAPDKLEIKREYEDVSDAELVEDVKRFALSDKDNGKD